MAIKPQKNWNSIEKYIEYLRHFKAYQFAKDYIKNKNILEVGCGNGYGTHYLASYAKKISAIDISEQNIQYCKENYSKSNIEYIMGNGIDLPFEKNTFDTIISFQVIEHISPKLVHLYLKEIKRVLKEDGIFILTTPNKKLRLLPFQKPWNPEHMIEYNNKEIEKLVKPYFDETKIYGLCASEDIFSIEYNRVKQSYLRIFLINPAVSIFKKFKFIKGSEMKKNKYNLSNFTLNKYSMDDLKIDYNCPPKSLDIIALCKKTRQ
ncbi:class I SAM-dependent methyltransferase [Methanobacterium formicicum]|uniref:Methyltransferase type 11 domain-containing protein n=1 Tax=Methanobacterium formicicum TaxID=2162 RepID=A0A090I1T8_METFO|nr:class I SAM-dependent methyltransferase [Methanobacterium formicicum]MDH2659773.1 class I SAM-dependent methyltransferase [Methanobacterium formicicum]CEA12804.1 hypothetical protein DSM1535_0442 [Methanobacterium formicicum]